MIETTGKRGALERRRVSSATVLGEDAATMSGYAARYNVPSAELVAFDGRRFVERISPRAFVDTLARGDDVLMYYNHDWDGLPLARRSSGTLSLRSDASGLAFTADIAQTSLGRDVSELMRRGDLDGAMSFAMVVRDDNWSTMDGALTRTVMQADLIEISPVIEPAYPQPRAQLSGNTKRAARLRELQLRSLESWIR